MRARPGKSAPARKPTIAMVAARAGVAVSTVSRFLNGGYVSRAVRERLTEVIRELGYTPSATARHLSLGRRGPIGVVVAGIEGAWFTQLLSGIEEELTRHHGSLMLTAVTGRGHDRSGVPQGWVRQRRVDGMIVAPSTSRERPLLEEALEANLPMVAVAPDQLDLSVNTVRCDNYDGGKQAGTHLASLGHTRIAFAGGPSYSLDSQHRLQGLRAGLAAEGIELRESDVVFCNSYLPDAGIAFGESFVKEPKDVTAVVLGSDAIALGFLRTIQQNGWRVPQDVSVMGFDGVLEGSLTWPGLTTVAGPTDEMGRVACRRLLAEIENPGKEHSRAVEYHMNLVVRESTGRAPKGRRRPRASSRK
jgi:DNA-binding LacI/PurR family transcriptional regulator